MATLHYTKSLASLFFNGSVAENPLPKKSVTKEKGWDKNGETAVTCTADSDPHTADLAGLYRGFVSVAYFIDFTNHLGQLEGLNSLTSLLGRHSSPPPQQAAWSRLLGVPQFPLTIAKGLGTAIPFQSIPFSRGRRKEGEH